MGLLKFFCKIPGGRSVLKAMFHVQHPALSTNFAGINFPNPVGLAAGFDKNGQWIDELAALGFGFVEVGTVTPLAQEGNPKPRLFRLKKDQAVINRMGFNNAGIDALVANLKKRKSDIIVGGNLGKNKATPNEKAVDDYLISFKALKGLVDYFVVNVSSPNTPGLRELQEKGPLLKILTALKTENTDQTPIFLKIAPDLNYDQVDDIIEIVKESGIAGIIATNTTLAREGLKPDPNRDQAGGLSGKPVFEHATEIVKYIRSKSNIAIMGVGGIHSAEDAQIKMEAGAGLVQVFTGFIYEGPGLIKKINKHLR